jgi:predicted flap endonuclease-1-like 5' DNA nuclease
MESTPSNTVGFLALLPVMQQGQFAINLEWWQILLILLLVILLVWWLIIRQRQAGSSPDEGSDDHPQAHQEPDTDSFHIHGQAPTETDTVSHVTTPLVVEPLVPIVESLQPTLDGKRHTLVETTQPPDDLVIIEGIGPKIAALLNDAGIATFAQLAGTDTSHLKEILNAAGLRVNDPTTWPEQARLAAAGDQEGLQKLQETLKGGRVEP